MVSTPNNLPYPITSFIGRAHDLAAASELLCDPAVRLMTLTGPAGVGKSRFALEMARDILPAFPDGVWLVELAGLSEPKLVTQAVSSLLNVSEQPGRPLVESLINICRDMRTLLIFDTCEHLLGPCADLIGTLLGSCPDIRILATSRSPLGMTGERVWNVLPLTLPTPSGAPSVAAVSSCEAVQLFADRAKSVLPEFRLTDQNIAMVAQICRRLDGVPLAIELAAVWVRTLAVEQIAARLDDRLGLLTGGSRTAPPRQQTLRAAIAWSCDLLSSAERTLFARLSVFAGDCSLEAIESVTADDSGGLIEPPQVLGLLARLVDASLVATEERGGQKRFRLLETLRAYGREILTMSGEADAIHERHARYFLHLAEAIEPALWGPDLANHLARLERDHDDLRAALRWSVGRGEADVALRLATSLTRFWIIRGHLSEGLRWLDGGLLWTAGTTPAIRSRALGAAGQLARHRGDYALAANYFEQSLAMYRTLGDRRGIALALNNLGVVAHFEGDYHRTSLLHEESLELFSALGDEQGVGLTLLTLGVMAHLQRDFDLAAERLDAALDCFRRLGDRHGVAATLNNLGNLASARNDCATATRYYLESLDHFRAMGDQREVASSLRNLASVARDDGDDARALAHCNESISISAELGDAWGTAAGLSLKAHIAAGAGAAIVAIRLFGAASAAAEQAVPSASFDQGETGTATLESLKRLVGEDRYNEAWAAGRASPLQEVIAIPIGSPPSPPTNVVRAQAVAALSRREREVAALIRSGNTNREIAEALFVAERTIDKHVEHILAKLQLRSRAQVASWATEHNLTGP